MENLHEWSERMQGAREMLIKLYEDDKMILPLGVKRSEDITLEHSMRRYRGITMKSRRLLQGSECQTNIKCNRV